MDKYLEVMPENVIANIFTYSSHPVADMFKKSECYMMHDTSFKVEDFTTYWQDVYRPIVGKHTSNRDWKSNYNY